MKGQLLAKKNAFLKNYIYNYYIYIVGHKIPYRRTKKEQK